MTDRMKYLLKEIKRCDGLLMKMCFSKDDNYNRIHHIKDRKDWLMEQIKQEVDNTERRVIIASHRLYLLLAGMGAILLSVLLSHILPCL